MSGPRKRRVAVVPPTRLAGSAEKLTGVWARDLPTDPAQREGVSEVVAPSRSGQDHQQHPGDAQLMSERPPHWGNG